MGLDELIADPGRARIGFIGGTGAQARGLAFRFVLAGHEVFLGSRDQNRAVEAQIQLQASLVDSLRHAVRGARNDEAASLADVVVVAVPWPAHQAVIAALSGQLADRLVIDCVNPLGFDERGPFSIPVAEGSAVEQAVQLLPASHVVGAFHHVSAVELLKFEHEVPASDVLVVGDSKLATAATIALIGQIPGLRGLFAGRSRNAGQVEAMAANLIAINRRYRVNAGLRVTGLSD